MRTLPLLLAYAVISSVCAADSARLTSICDCIYTNAPCDGDVRWNVKTATEKAPHTGVSKRTPRLRETFKHQGKPWSDVMEMRVKADVAELVGANPGTALNPHRRAPFDALVNALQTKLNAIAASKK